MNNVNKLYKKCLDYEKSHLRIPPEHLVISWGNKLNLSRAESQDVYSRLDLRYFAGKA